jgi:hypothetical protein
MRHELRKQAIVIRAGLVAPPGLFRSARHHVLTSLPDLPCCGAGVQCCV